MKNNYINKIIAFDKSNFSRMQAKAHGFEYCDETTQLPLINFIFSSHSIEHVPNLPAILKEFKRVSALKSYFFIEVPHMPDFEAFMACKVHAPHTYCFSKQGLIAALATADFKLVSDNAIVEVSQGRAIRALFQKS